MRMRNQAEIGVLVLDQFDVGTDIVLQDDIGIEPYRNLMDREKCVGVCLNPAGDPRRIGMVVWGGSHLPDAVIVPWTIREAHVVDVWIDALRQEEIFVITERWRCRRRCGARPWSRLYRGRSALRYLRRHPSGNRTEPARPASANSIPGDPLIDQSDAALLQLRPACYARRARKGRVTFQDRAPRSPLTSACNPRIVAWSSAISSLCLWSCSSKGTASAAKV